MTLLLGTNSSGKSSLVQGLLLLKQTVQSPDRTIHLDLGGDEASDLFDFGGFDDVLHRQEGAPRWFSLAFSFAHPGPGRVAAGSFACSYARTPAGAAVVREMAMTTGGRSFRALRREQGAYALFVDDEARPRLKGRQYAPERAIALSADAIAALDKDGQLAEDLSLAIRRALEGIHYLGPLRGRPQRAYAWSKSRPGEIGGDGRAAIDALLASALLRGDGQADVLEGVSRWLSRMRLADRFEVRQQGRSGRHDGLAREAGLVAVPRIAEGDHTVAMLEARVAEGRSRFREGVLEGVVVRREDEDWLLARGKLVRADFTQAIEGHWRSRKLEWNRIDWQAGSPGARDVAG